MYTICLYGEVLARAPMHGAGVQRSCPPPASSACMGTAACVRRGGPLAIRLGMRVGPTFRLVALSRGAVQGFCPHSPVFRGLRRSSGAAAIRVLRERGGRLEVPDFVATSRSNSCQVEASPSSLFVVSFRSSCRRRHCESRVALGQTVVAPHLHPLLSNRPKSFRLKLCAGIWQPRAVGSQRQALRGPRRVSGRHFLLPLAGPLGKAGSAS